MSSVANSTSDKGSTTGTEFSSSNCSVSSPQYKIRQDTTRTQQELRDQNAVAAHLVEVTHGFVEAINTREYRNHPSQQHLDPFLRCSKEYRPATTTLEEHWDVMDTFFKLYPGHHKELASCTAHVNLKAGYADVYSHFVEVGIPDGVVRDSMAVMEWRLKGEKWWCVRYTGIRGLPGDRGLPGNSDLSDQSSEIDARQKRDSGAS